MFYNTYSFYRNMDSYSQPKCYSNIHASVCNLFGSCFERLANNIQ